MFPDVGASISDHRQQIVMRGMPLADDRIAQHRLSNHRRPERHAMFPPTPRVILLGATRSAPNEAS